MDRAKKVLSIVLPILLWVIGLVFSTYFVLTVNNRIAKRSDIDLDRLKNDSVIFFVEKISSSQNLFKDVTVSGWAFIENEGENPNKKTYLIFASEVGSYIFEMRTYNRFDLSTAPTLANFTVPKLRNGFEGTFSPLSMKNGQYKLLIFVHENDQIEGVTDTGKEYTKYYGNFVENVGGKVLTDIKTISSTEAIVNSHFLCNIVNSNVVLDGWAFVEHGNLKDVPSQPIVELLGPEGKITYFSTMTKSRADVAQTFNAKALLLSGFSSEIPTDFLGKGDNFFKIIFDAQGESNYACKITW